MSRVGPRAATAYIAVRPDFTPFDRQVDAERGKMKQRFAGLGKAAAAGLAVGVAVGGKAAVKAAVDLGEQINKTKVVFRGHEKTVLNWSKTTSTAIGTSRREALEAAGTFGNMLVPMGFARKEAAKWSVSLVKLAADLASFNNASPADTLEAVRAGLAGETEPLRKYGIFLNDARLKQEALNLGLKNSVGPNGALTANAKAQATYALILKDSADAQGDFHRTSSSLANQQRILKAQVEDVGAAVGKELIPPLTVAAKFTSKFIHQMQTGKGPGGEFAGVVSDLAKGAKDAAETVGPVLLDIGKFAAKHDSVVKVAGGVAALALGLKGIKGAGKVSGITDLLGLGKKTLGRGGLPGITSKAAPIPVYVTNWGAGKPGAPVPGPGGSGKPEGRSRIPKWVSTPVKGLGWVALPLAPAAITLGLTESGALRFNPPATRELGRASPLTGDQRAVATGAAERRAHLESEAMRALRIRSIGREIDALEHKVVASRRSAQKLREEGASEHDVARAEGNARDQAYKLARAKYEMAKAAGEASRKVERLRTEVNRLRSKRISVAVDINIPSLNVRAPGNLTGTGPQGPGMRTGDSGPGGDGWGIGRGISAKVRARVKASARQNPMAYLAAVGGGPVGGGPGAFHAFDPLAARFGLHLSSGYRPGSITSSGNVSYHALNRAGDYSDGSASMLNFARFMAAVFGSKLKELIHTPLGFSIKNGSQVAPYAQADHYDHVHVALAKGGQTRTAVRALVGERGPEVVDLPADSIVHPARMSRRLRRTGDGWGISGEYRRLIRIASKRYGIPPRVLAGLIKVESGWNPNAVSPAGAFGLTQFMPGTAAGYGVARGSGHHAVATQILGAAHYLKDLGYASDRRRALGAYNGGPGNPQYGYADDVLAAAAGYGGIGAGGVAEDSPKWNWATMGNKRRTVMNLGGVRLHVGAKRFARLVRRGQIDWKRTKHLRGDKWARKHFPGRKKWTPPPGPTDAGNAFMNAWADQLGMRSALAALTPETTDDIAVLQEAVRGWQGWLDWARSQHDTGAITTAATNLKSAQDALTELTGAGATTDLAQQQIDVGKESNAIEARKVALLESQGPQLLAGLAMFSGDVLGRNAGRNRGFPSFAGVGGLART